MAFAWHYFLLDLVDTELPLLDDPFVSFPSFEAVAALVHVGVNCLGFEAISGDAARFLPSFVFFYGATFWCDGLAVQSAQRA